MSSTKQDHIREEKGVYLNMDGYITSFSAPTDAVALAKTISPGPGMERIRRASRERLTRFALPTPISKLVKYITRRWRIFAEYTTLHGVNEIYYAPLKKLKIAWLCVLAICASILFYQIYMLTEHYLDEPTTTTVTVQNEWYQFPLFMLIARTTDLFINDKRIGRSKYALDKEALIYARSLVDKKVHLPKGYNFIRGRKKFDKILVSNPGMTWHDLLEPHILNLSYWIGTENKLRVSRRSLWNGGTYHILEPMYPPRPTDMNHEFVIELTLNWTALNIKSSTTSNSLLLTSYGLLAEGTPLESGYIYKIRFELTSHRSVNLRRKPCRPVEAQYLLYDRQKCDETCFLKAEQLYSPRKCYNTSRFSWGFYELYRHLRPCSNGFFNASGGPYLAEHPDKFVSGSEDETVEYYKKCLKINCSASCEQLSVKTLTHIREFGEDLVNRSLLFVTWPAPTVVPVYVEALQHTWDSFVGQIGGLIGLWLGASMISAVEAMYLCCCCCYDVATEDGVNDDEERIFGRGNEKLWYTEEMKPRRAEIEASNTETNRTTATSVYRN